MDDTTIAIIPNEIALDDLASKIRTEHDAVQRAVETATEHAIRCGQLLTEAKDGLVHGQWLPWLEEHCEVSERTAQAYMRLARELPKLDDAKAQRVADLSFREALTSLSEGSSRIARLPAAEAERALQLVESGELDRLKDAATAAKLLSTANSAAIPRDLKPTATEDRSTQIEAHEADQRLAVVIGPNAAGTSLGDNVAELRQRPDYQSWQADIEEMKQQAEALRDQADGLEKQARDERKLMNLNIKTDLDEEHGPALSFVERIEFEVIDDALFQHLKTLEKEEVVNFLLDETGGEKVKEQRRDYYGDISLLPYSSTKIDPSRNPDGWTGIGGPGYVGAAAHRADLGRES